MAGFLDDKSTLDAISRVVKERAGGVSQLTVGRVIVCKNRSGQERGTLGNYHHYETPAIRCNAAMAIQCKDPDSKTYTMERQWGHNKLSQTISS
jgi:predicted GNAT family N-acyltransferase